MQEQPGVMADRETMLLPLDDPQGGAEERRNIRSEFRDLAFSSNRGEPVHRWVPWIAGYSRQFVANAIDSRMGGPGAVLDPFAGVGTTLVEADRKGHEATGFEINPYAAFAARTKLAAHRVDTARLRNAIGAFEQFARDAERQGREPRAAPPAGFNTRAAFYSPEVQWKVLTAQDFIAGLCDYPVADFFRLAFASTMVTYSNYSYEPSLGRKATAGRSDVDDYPVFAELAEKLTVMAADADFWRGNRNNRQRRFSKIHGSSFFKFYKEVKQGSIDLLITSPPYLNNYHYNRNTRPHLYWLGFCNSPKDFRKLEHENFGTYWQTARDMAPVPLDPAIANHEIDLLVAELRTLNPEKGIYGGRGWANYAALYFNDCLRFAEGMKWCLRPGATALIVIGNSILQGIPVPTDRFLAEIAERAGMRTIGIHTPRDARVGNSIVNSSVRVGKANGGRLYESVVELRRP